MVSYADNRSGTTGFRVSDKIETIGGVHMCPITYCRQNGFKCDDKCGKGWKSLMMAISQAKPERRTNGRLYNWTKEECHQMLELARRFEQLMVFE